MTVDGGGEFVELFHPGQGTQPLSGCRLLYTNAGSTTAREYRFPEGASIGESNFLVVFIGFNAGAFYRTDLFSALVCTDISGIQNSGFSFALLDGCGNPVDSLDARGESSGGFAPRGSSDTNCRRSMERRWPPLPGTDAEAWKAASAAVNVSDNYSSKTFATPGAMNSGWLWNDTEPPHVIWTAPENGATNRGGSVRAAVSATDNGEVRFTKLTVDGCCVWSGSDEGLDTNLPLAEGTHTLVFEAIDGFGNTAESARNILVVTSITPVDSCIFEDFETGTGGWKATNGCNIIWGNPSENDGCGFGRFQASPLQNEIIAYSDAGLTRGDFSILVCRVRGSTGSMPLVIRAGVSNCYWKIGAAAVAGNGTVSPSGSASYTGGGFDTLGQWKDIRLLLTNACVPVSFPIVFRGGNGGIYDFSVNSLVLMK